MTAPKLYLETSVVSYLTAEGSRDLVLAAHQEVTRAWWASRESFDVYASQFVLDEAAAGDAIAAAKRQQVLKDIPLLDVTAEAVALAARLITDHGLPSGTCRCAPCCSRSSPRDGLLAQLELQAHRECNATQQDRVDLPSFRL